jgi:hypothetical protein
MKFHRQLTEEEARELTAIHNGAREISGGFISLKKQAVALQAQQLENLREAVEIQPRVKAGDPEATGHHSAIISANQTIQAQLEALNRESERLTKSSTAKLFSAWVHISAMGLEMETATREKIAMEFRHHFARKDEAEYLAGQTQTVRDIAFHLGKDRVPFGQVQHGWEDGQVGVALNIINRITDALLKGSEVVPDVTPFAINQEEEAA